MTEAEQALIDIAILMAQELQEYVDVAIECAGSNSAELATQELLQDWERAYAAAGMKGWQGDLVGGDTGEIAALE
jgi:hypothetical protein